MLAKLLVNAYSSCSSACGPSAAITPKCRQYPPAASQGIVLGAPCGMTMREYRGAATRAGYFSKATNYDIGDDGSEDDNQHRTSAAAATKHHTWGPIRRVGVSHHARSCEVCRISQVYGSGYGSRTYKGFSPLSEEDRYCPAASTTLRDSIRNAVAQKELGRIL